MKQNFIHLIKSLLLMYLLLATGTPKAYCQEPTIYQIVAYIKDGSVVFPTDVGYDGKIVLWPNTDYVFWVQKNDFDKGWVKSLSGSTCNITDQGATISLEYLMSPSKGNPVNISEDFEACVFRINSEKEEQVQCCFKIESYDGMQYTFSISIHGFTKENGLKEATCTTDGYSSMICPICEEENRQIIKATGHAFGEWHTMEGGRFRTCNHDESHIQYDMDATEVNTLEITLTDGTKLSYPQTLNPVVSFNDLDLSISFDTDKTSLVSKADIAAYNQVWPHNKNGYTQNEDKTYSHKCDYAGCGYDYNDLSVKNGAQYYVAEKEDGVIKVADMTLNDSEGYDCEADITVGSVSYSRDMTGNQWGTLCLPFAINPSAYAEYCSFYKLSSVDNEKSEIVLSRIDDSTIAAGTPVLVRRNADVSGISISVLSEEEGDGVVMSKHIQTGSTAGDYSLVGTLTTSDALTENCYIINNDKFWNVGDLISNGKATTVKVGAFRSYLEANTPSAPAMMLSLSIGDDDTTAIDVLNAADDGEAEIYDLNGHRLPDLQKGVNIVKRGNKTTKVIIK